MPLQEIEATSHYLGELKKAGKVVEGGFLSVSYGGVAIFEVDSLVELDNLSERLPARPLCDAEVLPYLSLEEFNSSWPEQKEYMRQMLEKMTERS